jgi:hypothetical protein
VRNKSIAHADCKFDSALVPKITPTEVRQHYNDLKNVLQQVIPSGISFSWSDPKTVFQSLQVILEMVAPGEKV